MRLLRLSSVVAPGLVLVISACGHSSSSAGQSQANAILAAAAQSVMPTAVPEACQILDDEIAKKWLGNDAAVSLQAHPNPHMTHCQYRGSKGVIDVMAGSWSFLHGPTSGTKPVPGLGDEAYVGFTGLQVRKGNVGIQISVMTDFGDFWGKQADAVNDRTEANELAVAPDLVARLK
jgi:hypothetical protein